jgi:hypothetical protein
MKKKKVRNFPLCPGFEPVEHLLRGFRSNFKQGADLKLAN